MQYTIFRKTFGTKQIVKFCELNTENPISDILWIEDLGIVYTSNNLLGLISVDGEHFDQWKGDADSEIAKDGSNPSFGYLSGLSYRNKTIYAGEDGGRDVRVIDVSDNYTSSLFKGNNRVMIDNVLRKIGNNTDVYVAVDKRNNVFLAYPSIRKCFCFSNCELKHTLGDGKCRFANGTDTFCTSIGSPSGIISDENEIYIADSFCGVIRKLNGKEVNVLCGSPKESVLEKPSKLLMQKSSLYILCNNSIRMFSLATGIVGKGSVYESDKILNITNDNSNGLYILEGANA
jgi:hypothetical protein